MAKDKLTDYDSTASGNLDVGGISVAEGMLPSGVNNAIRELMSHQADAFGAGTPLYVDQTNNRLGIGNAAPTTALDVTGTVQGDALVIDGNSVFNGNATIDQGALSGNTLSLDRTGADGTVGFFNSGTQTGLISGVSGGGINAYVGSTPSLALAINASGSVGIGTASPQSIVHIDQGAADDAQLILETHSAGDSKMVFSQGQTAGNWAVGYDDGGGVTDNSFSFAYKSNGYPSLSGQNLMVLTPAGSLGIGTVSPAYTLQVGEGNGQMSLGNATSGNGSSRLKFLSSTSQKNWQISTNDTIGGALEFTQTTAGGGTTFATSPAMLIDSSGSLAIGTSSIPTGKLAVEGGIYLSGSSNFLRFGADSSTTTGVAIHRPAANTLAFVTASTERLRIDGSGRVTMPYQPSFAVTRNQGNVSNAVYVYPNAYHNTGNHYNSSNGRFTAPVAGSYFIATNHMSNNNATHTNVQYAIRVNGANQQLVYSSSGSAVHHRWSWAGVFYLNQGDYIDVFVASGLTLYGGDNSYTQFSGHLLG